MRDAARSSGREPVPPRFEQKGCFSQGRYYLWQLIDQIGLGKRRTYDLEKAERSVQTKRRPDTSGRRRFFRLPSLGRNRNKLSTDERFLQALYYDGLLVDNFTIDEASNPKSPTVLLENDRPVLAMCYGFKNYELRGKKFRRRSGTNQHTLPSNYRSTANIRQALDRVLQHDGDVTDEPEVDGIPASLWFKVLEPAMEILLSLTRDRSNRLNVTRLRGASQFPRDFQSVVGDFQTTLFPQGPVVNLAHHRGGRFAMLNNRLMELGGRSRRHRNARLADLLLPANDDRSQTHNISRSRVTLADPRARRHGVSVTNRATETRDDITVSDHYVPPPIPLRRGNMVFH